MKNYLQCVHVALPKRTVNQFKLVATDTKSLLSSVYSMTLTLYNVVAWLTYFSASCSFCNLVANPRQIPVWVRVVRVRRGGRARVCVTVLDGRTHAHTQHTHSAHTAPPLSQIYVFITTICVLCSRGRCPWCSM